MIDYFSQGETCATLYSPARRIAQKVKKPAEIESIVPLGMQREGTDNIKPQHSEKIILVLYYPVIITALQVSTCSAISYIFAEWFTTSAVRQCVKRKNSMNLMCGWLDCLRRGF